MNCDDLTKCLASGRPLPDEAAAHFRECPGCRSLLTALRSPKEMPDPQRLEQLAKRLAAATKPVRPLPSDRRMMLFSLTLFVAFTLLTTSLFGFNAIHHLRAFQKTWYYAVILFLAVLFSAATVKEIIPGSRKHVHPLVLTGSSLLLLAATVTALFPRFYMKHFSELGVPCIELGLACAAVSGLLASWFVRKGYAAAPIQASVVVGAFAGLSGVAVLALHCPVQNASHILVWHISSMLISGLAGAGFGSLIYKPGKLAEEP